MSSRMKCIRCGGCADRSCHGTCNSPRWCRSAIPGETCDACPYLVSEPIPGTRGTRLVRCVRTFNHGGNCRPY